jgi:hypothetical protein
MARPPGTIKYANLDNSPRLQRLMHLLSDCREHSTLDIIHGAGICAVNTAVAELRKNIEVYGINIICRKADRNRYMYQLQVDKGGTVCSN